MSSKRKLSSKEWTHRLMKTSLSMQEEIEWVGGWKKHWTLEITFYVEMVWSINCDEQSLIWQYRNCWNDVFRICIKCQDILLLHKFEKEYLVYIWRSSFSGYEMEIRHNTIISKYDKHKLYTCKIPSTTEFLNALS